MTTNRTARRHSTAEALDAARAMLADGKTAEHVRAVILENYEHICDFDAQQNALMFAQYGSIRAYLPLSPEVAAAELARIVAWQASEAEAERQSLPAALTPESNTEAAQQCAAELEQGDEPAEDSVCTLHQQVICRGIVLAGGGFIPASTHGCLLETMHTYSDGAPCSRPYHVQFYVGRASYDFWASDALLIFPPTQPNMFAATSADLPLFSGTAPRATVTPFVETEPQPTTPRLF